MVHGTQTVFFLLLTKTILVTPRYTDFLANKEGASRLVLRTMSGINQG